MNFHTNHKVLLAVAATGFLVLSMAIAIIPAFRVQNNNPALNTEVAKTDAELRGKAIYIAEGCQACHTQQVRSNIIDQAWGDRPSIPADFANNTRPGIFRNTASVLGSERTGPDLTNVGQRQPEDTWHYLHLYNPRSVVQASIMPAYPWLFQVVDKVKPGHTEVHLPDAFQPKNGKHIVTTNKAEDLVAYLKSLKQAELPEYLEVEFDSYDWQQAKEVSKEGSPEVPKLDGAKLYAANCAVCHQANGGGVPNAFPSLKGSSLVNASNPTEMITAVLFGMDKDNQFGAMIPFESKLSDAEIAAIISHERTSWGNKASEVTGEEVKIIRAKGKPAGWPNAL